jgi:hypothetical protein
MAKENKKAARQAFRDAVFKRAGYRCQKCSFVSSVKNSEQELDAHHITERCFQTVDMFQQMV